MQAWPLACLAPAGLLHWKLPRQTRLCPLSLHGKAQDTSKSELRRQHWCKWPNAVRHQVRISSSKSPLLCETKGESVAETKRHKNISLSQSKG